MLWLDCGWLRIGIEEDGLIEVWPTCLAGDGDQALTASISSSEIHGTEAADFIAEAIVAACSICCHGLACRHIHLHGMTDRIMGMTVMGNYLQRVRAVRQQQGD